jgi:NAD-dependent dihydropyrimidine dehydrogenase PreA subunit
VSSRLSLGDLVAEIVQTAMRLVPWSTEPGVRAIGDPGPDSPVLITGNFDLGVRRLVRSLAGLDAWLVVAPSSGINVWCASSGGHLGTHQVVTALKTSGIAERVRHRRAILPQLAATGVIARDVGRRCGWSLRFGPVRASDVPAYLDARMKKTDDMRRVRFGVRERLEMAAVWALPTALVVGGVSWFIRSSFALPSIAFVFALAAAVFLFFDRLPEPRRLLFGALAMAGFGAATWLANGDGVALAAAPAVALGLVGLLTFDYSGSTPVEGGSHFEEHEWHIALDAERCKGVFSCVEVCPEACFDPREDPRRVEVRHGERCIRCGACVVQCPQDALAFEDETGRRIAPDTIRRFKLNLLGKRAVDAGPADK